MNYAFAGHAALMGSYHPQETQLDKWVQWLRNGYRRLIDILEQAGKLLSDEEELLATALEHKESK